jgi:hypothetical protein
MAARSARSTSGTPCPVTLESMKTRAPAAAASRAAASAASSPLSASILLSPRTRGFRASPAP